MYNFDRPSPATSASPALSLSSKFAEKVELAHSLPALHTMMLELPLTPELSPSRTHTSTEASSPEMDIDVDLDYLVEVRSSLSSISF